MQDPFCSGSTQCEYVCRIRSDNIVNQPTLTTDPQPGFRETEFGYCEPPLANCYCVDLTIQVRYLFVPSGTEVCDGYDNDCDGFTDEGYDLDGDGYTSCDGDCNDDDADIHPHAPRNCLFSAGQDVDCSGVDDDLECIGSPIVIDIAGNGFNLTNAANGVVFDLNSDGTREQLSWTSANSDDAWLSLDRNGNGRVDNGRELFGDITPQPTSSNPNGFIALAEYDKTSNGGNSDGVINNRDSVFSSLRLWQDTNQNGISEANELKTLSSLGLVMMELDYKESKKTDEHGNQFKYRAKVKDKKGRQIGRWAWDVFLLIQQPQS